MRTINKSSQFRVRPLRLGDNKAIGQIIRKVMIEYGASGPGFSIHDLEVDNMFGAYNGERSAYFVICSQNNEEQVLGGAGIAELAGGNSEVCELKKMYFLKTVRGNGFGQTLLDLCLASAKSLNYKICYLETLKGMSEAQSLYLKNGFTPLKTPLGNTGHFGCDAWYSRKL
jgi:putative acetyltransferase